MIINMVTDIKCFPMDQSTKDSTSMENQKESENTTGPMENSIRDSGSTDSNMAQECGREPNQIAM